MNDEQYEAARAGLAAARQGARRIEPLPAAWIPDSLEVAARLQLAVAADLGEIRGWKISGLTADQQRAMGVPRPLSGPLLAPWFGASNATFTLAGFIAPRLECEFAFELARDLPARATPYSRTEVEAAIGALRIGVEIVDSRLPAGSPVPMELADGLNNGGFVVGAASSAWRTVRYAEQAIVLRRRHDGSETELARGDGRAVLDGDPVGAVVLLANLPSVITRGLRAGDVVTTGSCTGAVPVPGRGDYEADFGSLGTVRLRFD